MAKVGQFSGGTVTYQPTPTVSPIKPVVTQKASKSNLGSAVKKTAIQSIPLIGPALSGFGLAAKAITSAPFKKVVDFFNIPQYAAAGAAKELEREPLSQGLRPNLSNEINSNFIPRVIEGAKQGLKEKTMFGDVLRAREEAGQKQSLPMKAGAFTTDLAFPALPVAGIVSKAGKLAKTIGVADKVSDSLRPVLNLAGKVTDIPAVNKVVEAISPGYKVPEVRKIMDEAGEVANVRVNQLARTIREASRGLSKTEQQRVGQLMEGGVTPIKDNKLAAVAKQMNDLADEIGAEGVALWEKTGGKFGLNPESYLKFKGKYMTHIWSEMTEGGKKLVSLINKPTGLSGQFYKLRKGAGGYIRQFAPATFKGLGTQIQDIEKSKGYLKIAEKYGIPMEKLQKPEDVVAEAVNQLLREYKAPKPGLGPVKFSGTMEPPKGVGQSTLQDITIDTGKLESGGFQRISNGNTSALIKGDTMTFGGKDYPVIKVESIVSQKSKTGSATELLNKLKRVADENGRVIYLEDVATPKRAYGGNPPESPMSQKDLTAWYEKNGFKRLKLADGSTSGSMFYKGKLSNVTQAPKANIQPPKGVGSYPAQNISNYLLDVFKKYLPASQMDTTYKQVERVIKDANGKSRKIKEWVRVATDNSFDSGKVSRVFAPSGAAEDIANYRKGVTGKVGDKFKTQTEEVTDKMRNIYKSLLEAELTGKTPQAIEKWVRTQNAAFQKVFGFTPDESALRVFLDQVGELPVGKPNSLKLDVGKAERLVQEATGYAPELIKKMGVGKLFEDVGLPTEVIDYINKVSQAPSHNLWDDAINAWKLGKTILNPAYHFRNIFSNQVLAGWSTGKNLFETSYDSIKAFTELHKKNGNIFKVAEDSGLINSQSFAKNMQEFLGEADLIANKNLPQRYINWWKKVQNVSEDTAKLNVFTVKIQEAASKAGRTIAEVLTDPKVVKMAKDAAEEAIFSPYRISVGERALLKRWIPFYAFTRQALPFYVKTLYKNPERVLPYHRLKPAIESQNQNLIPEEGRAEWQKEQIQLPDIASKTLGVKEPIALDTTYLFPQGNFGEDMGNSVGKGQLPFGLSLNPFLMEGVQQATGQDLYFDQPFGKGSLPGFDVKDFLSPNPRRQTSEKIDHLANTLGPGLYRTIKGKLYPAFAGIPDYAGRERSKIMSVLDALGLKMSILRPDDQKKFQASDQYQVINQIKKEMRSIAGDKSLTPERKKEYMDLYIKQLNEEVANQK